MFLINENTMKLSLSKGDTATVGIKIDDLEGSPYQIKDSDTLTLSVKRNVNRPVVLNIVANEDHKFIFKPYHTKDLEAGIYLYDVQLQTEEGNTYTLITSRFVLLDEITD